jgi:hypothetical protein
MRWVDGVESIHRLEAPKPTQVQTELLVERLEDVLTHLSYENYEPPGSCCACLQDMEIQGHLPSCVIHLALIEIEEWRE